METTKDFFVLAAMFIGLFLAGGIALGVGVISFRLVLGTC